MYLGGNTISNQVHMNLTLTVLTPLDASQWTRCKVWPAGGVSQSM